MAKTVEQILAGGLPAARAMWPTPSPAAWRIIASFGALEAALQLLTPGKTVQGPVTPRGNIPIYTANGVQRYLLTLVLMGVGWLTGTVDLAAVYDCFGEIIAALNIFSLLFCAGLYVKGRFAPSSTDSGSTGSLVYDYYWGVWSRVHVHGKCMIMHGKCMIMHRQCMIMHGKCMVMHGYCMVISGGASSA